MTSTNMYQPLKNDDLTLEPLTENHFEQLILLSQDPSIWVYSTYACAEPKMFEKTWLKSALSHIEQKERVCYTVCYQNKIVGSSSYYDIDFHHKRLNIGYTWYHPTVWGTKVNTLTKLLMLEYALEKLNFNRVGFSIDTRNTAACRSLKKLGAVQEGVLRNHMILPDNHIRDTMMFSIIRAEWPAIKLNLQTKIK